MTERIKKTEKRQQEQEGHRGWTQGTDSQRPEDRGDSWQDFDTKKARSTLTAEQKKTRNDAAARGGGRVRGEERQQRERTRGRAVLMCAREIDTRETVCWECVGIRGTLFFFFFQRTDRTYLKAKLWSKFTTRARREKGMETGDMDRHSQTAFRHFNNAAPCKITFAFVHPGQKYEKKIQLRYTDPTQGKFTCCNYLRVANKYNAGINRLHTFHMCINDHVIHTCVVWYTCDMQKH